MAKVPRPEHRKVRDERRLASPAVSGPAAALFGAGDGALDLLVDLGGPADGLPGGAGAAIVGGNEFDGTQSEHALARGGDEPRAGDLAQRAVGDVGGEDAGEAQ